MTKMTSPISSLHDTLGGANSPRFCGPGFSKHIAAREAGEFVRCARVFGVAAVDHPSDTAHQRRHLGPDRKLTDRIRLHQANALDANNFDGFSPFAPAHLHLDVVETDFDVDDDVARLGFRIQNLLVKRDVALVVAAEVPLHDLRDS